ncbi:MAG TPA: pentapeptide repeat-containing protein [Blastocatellia bacterium]|nr:pentapeptide repeat-containing protein [Blastocatellia bacterium]
MNGYADLSNAKLISADLSYADPSGAALQDAVLKNADLSGANSLTGNSNAGQ